MRCCLCKKEISLTDPRQKIKGGTICSECFQKFPLGIQKSIKVFNQEQLLAMKCEFYPQSDFPWLQMGNLGLTDTDVLLNGFQYPLKKIETVSLEFHPKTSTGHETVKGIICCVLKMQNFLIEEPLFQDDQEIPYKIDKGKIILNIPLAYIEVMAEINRAVQSGKSLEGFREEKRREEQKREEKRRKQDADQKKKELSKSLNKALRRYHLSRPFTTEQVLKARNEILGTEKIHPDNGGTNEAFVEIYDEYKLLLKYASDTEKEEKE